MRATMQRASTGETAGITRVSASTTSTGAAEVTWTIWTDNYSTTSNYAFAEKISLATWGAWNLEYATNCGTCSTDSITYTLRQTWSSWSDGYDLMDERRAQEVVRKQQSVKRPSSEELERWRREEQERREREELAAKQRLTARTRARELLVSQLTPEQRESFAKKKFFYLECHSADGSKRRYRIDEGTHGNVKLVNDKNQVVGSYCVQPNGVPTEDAMLAQVLWLRTNEAEFKRKANYRAA